MTFIGTSWTVSAFKSSAFEVDGTFINVRTDDDAIIADFIKIFESYESFPMSHIICVIIYKSIMSMYLRNVFGRVILTPFVITEMPLEASQS